MRERAKLLKVTAIIASFIDILFLMFIILICDKDGLGIYPYLGLLIVVTGCNIKLWKMYIDEKKV